MPLWTSHMLRRGQAGDGHECTRYLYFSLMWFLLPCFGAGEFIGGSAGSNRKLFLGEAAPKRGKDFNGPSFFAFVTGYCVLWFTRSTSWWMSGVFRNSSSVSGCRASLRPMVPDCRTDVCPCFKSTGGQRMLSLLMWHGMETRLLETVPYRTHPSFLSGKGPHFGEVQWRVQIWIARP